MSADPKISVVMPVHNGAAWLAEAIESVLAQTLAEFELIVVDDGSTDASPDIIAALGRRDDRIHAVRQPQRQGIIAARNRALTLARAPLLAALDADDFARPDRLACQARFFDEQPDLVVLGSWAETMDEGGRSIRYIRPETNPERLAEILRRRNPFVHSSTMIRTDLARQLGGYRDAFFGAEDFDLLAAHVRTWRVANLPQTLVRYRVHGGSASRRLALRQCFSTRLACAAAAARASSGADPADVPVRPSRLVGPAGDE